MTKAQCLLLRNRPQEAADILDSMTDDELQTKAQFELANCHIALGQYRDALAIWGGLAELYGSDPVAKESAKRSREIERALDKAQKLTEKLQKKKNPADYFELGQIYYETLLDPQKATEAAKSILKEFPDSKEAKEIKELDAIKKIEEKFATD